VRKNSDAASDEERGRLEPTGEFHLGEFVNRFRHGSLVMRMPDSEAAQIPTVVFGTVNGVIGVIASLPQEQFVYLHKLQNCLTEVRRLLPFFSLFCCLRQPPFRPLFQLFSIFLFFNSLLSLSSAFPYLVHVLMSVTTD
jgi:hypothetical protein